MNNLLPGSFLLPLEHVLKLHNGVSTVKIDLLGPLFKPRDCFVNIKFDAEFATVLVDFGHAFIARIIALQFVGLG